MYKDVKMYDIVEERNEHNINKGLPRKWLHSDIVTASYGTA